MLLIAHANAAENGTGIAVASINHGLRAEAASEVALVERVCAELGVPFTALSVELASGNVQAKARDARYAALAKWAADHQLGAVATAHHVDDQAETLLMRLGRGSGLSGLAGVRAATTLPGTEMALLRPLLSWRKAELEQVVADAGITAADDPSNRDDRYDRARMRARIAEADWLDVSALANSAQNLSDAWRAIEWYADEDWETRVYREKGSGGGPEYNYYANVPRAISIETIIRIIAALGGQASRSEAGRAFDRLWEGDNASLSGVLITPGTEKIAKLGMMMRVWRFAPEPPRAMH